MHALGPAPGGWGGAGLLEVRGEGGGARRDHGGIGSRGSGAEAQQPPDGGPRRLQPRRQLAPAAPRAALRRWAGET
jgi:hypothetical protein